MRKQHTLWLAVILTLIGSLMAVPIATGAQEPLTESFTWAPYNVTLQYPAGWALNSAATRVSLHPADRDVSDGAGPELVLFYQAGVTANQIDSAIAALQAHVSGSASEARTGTLAGYPTRAFDFTQLTPTTAQGSLTLIALDSQTVIGVAYVARAGDASTYLPVLEAMVASLGLPPVPEAVALSSVSTASVQLSQVMAWDAVGLSFAFPADWTVDTSTPDTMLARATQVSDVNSAARTITVARMERSAAPDLRGVMESVLSEIAPDAALAEVTVNGLTGIAAEYLDQSGAPALQVSTVLFDVSEHNALVLVTLISTEDDWAAFHPIASAFTGSIAPFASGPAGGLSSRTPIPSTLHLISAPAPESSPLPRQGTETQTYTWEEMGITFEIPVDWTAYPGTQDYDLALVSPAAAAGGSGGFVTISAITYLEQSLEEALQPVAEQVSSSVETFTVAGLDGARVVAPPSEGDNSQQLLVLLPYGDAGEVLYFQGVATADEADVIDAILSSMVITPLHADADAINAAWQASLAENGTLVYGDPDAPAHVVEFLSFTCGHCANYTAEMERLVALEVEGTGRVLFETAPVMWDEYAARAARSLYCAVEQGQGYTAYKALYHGYFADGYDVTYTEEGLIDVMTGLGLDLDAYAACVQEDRYADVITAVESRFRDSGITGTPTLAFGVEGADPMPVPVSGGDIWSGRIPLAMVRDILNMLLDDKIPLEQLFAAQ